MSDGASFETERLRDDQPARDDLIDPERIETEDLAAEEVEEEPYGERPSEEELPETQGMSVDEAERLTEDQAARPELGDEAT